MADEDNKFYTVTIGKEKNIALTPAGITLPQLVRYGQEKKGARLAAVWDDHGERFIRYAVTDVLSDEKSNLGRFYSELPRQHQPKYDAYVNGQGEEWKKLMLRADHAPEVDKNASPKVQAEQKEARQRHLDSNIEMYQAARDKKIPVRLADDINYELEDISDGLYVKIKFLIDDYASLSAFFDKDGKWIDIRKSTDAEFKEIREIVKTHRFLSGGLTEDEIDKARRDDLAKPLEAFRDSFFKKIDYPPNTPLTKEAVKEAAKKKLAELDKKYDEAEDQILAWRNKRMADFIIKDMKAFQEQLIKDKKDPKNATGLLLVGGGHLNKKDGSLLDLLKKEKELGVIRIDVLPVDADTLLSLGSRKVYIGGTNGADYTVIVLASDKPLITTKIEKTGKITDSPHIKEWMDIQNYKQQHLKEMPNKEGKENNSPSPPLATPRVTKIDPQPRNKSQSAPG